MNGPLTAPCYRWLLEYPLPNAQIATPIGKSTLNTAC